MRTIAKRFSKQRARSRTSDNSRANYSLLLASLAPCLGGTFQAVRRISMQRKKLRFVSLGVLLGALLVTSSMTAEGGINSWTSTNGPGGGSIGALAIDPVTPSTLYAGAYSGGVFKSTDGGGGWTAVNTGLTDGYVLALAIDPQTPATLYAGTDNGVFKSTNGGGSWSAVNTGLPNVTSVLALAIDPQAPTTLYLGTGSDGVFKSTNGGGSWSAVNTGL